MKAYLRNKATRKYYSGSHHWTEDYRKAVSFETVPAAATQAEAEHLQRIEVVLIETGRALQIVFPTSTLITRNPARR
jgi:hypothetical protein